MSWPDDGSSISITVQGKADFLLFMNIGCPREERERSTFI